MREQPKRDWVAATKRQWVKPEVQEIALTTEVLRLFKGHQSNNAVLDKLEGKSASGQRD